MIIVGVDIAKRNHEASLVSESGIVLGKPFSFSNSHDGVNKLLNHISKFNTDDEAVVFVMEATGHYWLPLFSRLNGDGFSVHVINPIQSDSLRNFFIRQTKTDAIDSFIIAEAFRFGKFTETLLAEPDMIALRQLCRYRLSLVDSISDVKRRVIALLDQVFPEYETLFSNIFGKSSIELLSSCVTPEEILSIDTNELASMLNEVSRGRFGATKAQELKSAAAKSFGVKIATDAIAFQVRQLIDQIFFAENQLAVLDKNIAEYYEKFICTIDSIPGVGKVTAAIILSEIGDINRFSEPAKLVAFAGIDPTVKQSGNFQGTKNKMSKRGSSYLRRAAWISANVASFHDPVLSAFYKKKRAEGKPHLVAVGAVARKLLYIIFALLKSGKLYDPTYAIS